MWTIGMLMKTRVQTVVGTEPIAECLALMRQNRFRHLPVVDRQGVLTGIVSDYDLLRALRTGGASDSVDTVVQFCPPALSNEDAIAILSRQLDDRRDCSVVVNESGHPIGLFTDSDGLELAESALRPWKLCSDVMTTGDLILGHPTDLAETSLNLMLDQRIRHLMVVDMDKALAGVVSHRDLVGRKLTPIGRLMCRTTYTVRPHTPLDTAVKEMARRKIGCLPVIGPDRAPIGIITRTDVLRTVTSMFEDMR